MKAVYLKDKDGNKVVTVPYYRIGDLFLTTIATNPSNYLGGTWELFGPGKVLVCVNTSDTNFNTVKKTGGSSTHSHSQGATGSTAPGVASHSHSFTTAASGYHSHGVYLNSDPNFPIIGYPGWSGGTWSSSGGFNCGSGSHSGYMLGTLGGGTHQHTGNTDYAGSGSAHTHTNPNTNSASSLQPYITCYVWIRTA